MALDDFDSSNIPPALNQPGDVDPDTGAVDSNRIVSRMATQGMQDFDKTWVQRPPKTAADQPDFTQYGKTKDELDATPPVDLTQFGEEATPQPKADENLGVTGNVKAGVKAAAQSAVSGAGSALEGAALVNGTERPSENLNTNMQALTSGVPVDIQPEDDQPANPQESQIYKAGKATKEFAQKAIPLTDAERNSVGGEVGSAVGGGIAGMGAGMLAAMAGGPVAGMAAGAAVFGAQSAGDTFEQAKAKGASDANALQAAGLSGTVGAALGMLPVGMVLTPVKRFGPGLSGYVLGKLAQLGANGGVFTTVGEAQHYIDTQIAHAYYDPDAKYDPSLKRAMGEFLAGGMFGILHPLHGDDQRAAAAAEAQPGAQPAAGALPPTGEAPGAAGAQPGAEPGPQPNRGGGGAGEQPGAQPGGQQPGAQQQAMPRGAQWDQTWQTTAAPAADEQAGKRWQTLAKIMGNQYGFASSDLKNASFADLARFMAAADALQANGVDRAAIRKMTPADMAQAMSDVQKGAAPENEQGGGIPGTQSNPINLQTAADVARAAAAVDQDHSGAQGEANNVQRGHATWNGLGLTLETGSQNVRRGTVPGTGETWEQTTGAPYGYWKGVKGADGDNLDVYVGPNPTAPTVFILDENDQKTGKFKQHKTFIGFQTPAQAYEAYVGSSGKAPSQVRGMSAMSVDQFRDWTKSGEVKKPLTPEPEAAAQPNPKNGAEPQPAGMAADTPSAEPVSDILAQAQDLKDPKNRRAALWLPAATVEHLAQMGKLDDAITGPSWHDFDGKGGILVARDLKTARVAKAERDAGRPVQEIVGHLIGSGNGKPADATHVVQQIDAEGNVTRERAVRENEARKVYQAFSQPGRTVRIVTPAEAIARRAELVAKEAGKPAPETATATHDDVRVVAEALAKAGINPAAVRPADIARAAEIAREKGISPEEAFPVAVLRSLVEDGHISPDDVKKVLGNEAAENVLESIGGDRAGRQPRAQEAGTGADRQAAVSEAGVAESGAASGARADQSTEAAHAERGNAGENDVAAGSEAHGGDRGIPAAGHQEGRRDDVHSAGGEPDAESEREPSAVGERAGQQQAADGQAAASSKSVRRTDKPLSLLEFIGKMGGLKPTAEWNAMGLDHRSKVVVPVQGYRNLIKRDGMTMDDLVENLREAGFIDRSPEGRPDDVGIYNDIYGLIDKELRGNKQYPIGAEPPTTVYDGQQAEFENEIEEQREKLHKALDEAAIPLHSLTPGLEERTVRLMHEKWTQGELFDPLDLMEAAAASLDRDHDEFTDAELADAGANKEDIHALEQEGTPQAGGDIAAEGEQAGRQHGLQQEEVRAGVGEAARGVGEGAGPESETAATERTEAGEQVAPEKLYHASSSENRDGIRKHGLLQSKSDAAITAAEMGEAGLGSGVYFASKKPQQRSGIDVWELDTKGLPLERDETTEPEDKTDNWWVHHEGDIPPARLKLVSSSTEKTGAGEQHVIPGAEPIGTAEHAQRGADEKLKPKAAQKAADEGLFGDESKQTDLVDMAKKPEPTEAVDARELTTEEPEAEQKPPKDEGDLPGKGTLANRIQWMMSPDAEWKTHQWRALINKSNPDTALAALTKATEGDLSYDQARRADDMAGTIADVAKDNASSAEVAVKERGKKKAEAVEKARAPHERTIADVDALKKKLDAIQAKHIAAAIKAKGVTDNMPVKVSGGFYDGRTGARMSEVYGRANVREGATGLQIITAPRGDWLHLGPDEIRDNLSGVTEDEVHKAHTQPQWQFPFEESGYSDEERQQWLADRLNDVVNGDAEVELHNDYVTIDGEVVGQAINLDTDKPEEIVRSFLAAAQKEAGLDDSDVIQIEQAIDEQIAAQGEARKEAKAAAEKRDADILQGMKDVEAGREIDDATRKILDEEGLVKGKGDKTNLSAQGARRLKSAVESERARIEKQAALDDLAAKYPGPAYKPGHNVIGSEPFGLSKEAWAAHYRESKQDASPWHDAYYEERARQAEAGEEQDADKAIAIAEKAHQAAQPTVDEFIANIERELAEGRHDVEIAPTTSMKEFREAAEKRGWTEAAYGKGRALWSADRKHVLFVNAPVEGNHLNVQYGERGKGVIAPPLAENESSAGAPEAGPSDSGKAREPTGELFGDDEPVETAEIAETVGETGIAENSSRPTETLSGAEKVRPRKAASIKQPQPEPSKIDDFGEKIHGARKDIFTGFRDALADGIDVATEPLSKSFPQPDYEKLAEAGVDKRGMALIAAMRDMIPIKPRKAWKAKQWVQQVKTVRHFAKSILDGEIDLAKVEEFAKKDYVLSDLPLTARAIEDVPPADLPKAAKYRISSGSYSMLNGDRFSPSKTFWHLEGPERRVMSNPLSNDPAIRSTYRDTPEAIVDLAKQIIAHELNAAEPKTADRSKYTDVGIYKDRRTNEAFIGLKVRSTVIRLKAGFPDGKAARDFLAEHRDDIQKQIDELRSGPNMRGSENRPRRGSSLREGDVAPDLFGKTFGFRGVQFGNYVEESRRQADLNRAFDALMDLSDVLGIPPRALSLDGSLGLAFGARGHGGKSAAAAHYEPDQVVINLTKNSGPGSLAHEWLHALDNYFAKRDNAPSGYMSERTRDTGPVREAVYQAWKNIEKTLASGGFAERSARFDEVRSKPYWNTTIEKAARAFERYIVDRLDEKGTTNDYLANIDLKGGAYPTEEEMKSQGIKDAFDRLFSTIEVVPGSKPLDEHQLGSLSVAHAAVARDITATPQFKRWFGDSKVVDENGKPRVVYHGTAGDFSTFEMNADNSRTEGASELRDAGVPALYFTDSRAVAEGFAEGAERDGAAPRVVEAYLRIERPYVIYAKGGSWPKFQREVIDAYRSGFHDGVILHGVDDGMFENAVSTVYVAFDPHQIKSAGGNSGKFSTTNPDIAAHTRPQPSRGLTDEAEAARQQIVAERRQVRTQIPGNSEWSERARQAKLEQRLTEWLDHMTGGRFSKGEFNIFYEPQIEVGGGGYGDVKTIPTVGGLYTPAARMVRIALSDPNYPNPFESAIHEGTHIALDHFSTDQERALLRSPAEQRRMAEYIAPRMGVTPEQAASMTPYEIEAHAGQYYIADRARGGTGAGLHTGIRRLFEHILDFFRKLGNWLRGLGFSKWEDVMDKVGSGEMGDRDSRVENPDTDSYVLADIRDDIAAHAVQESAAMRMPAPVEHAYEGLRDKVADMMGSETAVNMKEGLSDYSHRMRMLQDDVESLWNRWIDPDGKLPDERQFYMLKRLFPGKRANRIAEFNKRYYDPLNKLLRDNAIPREQADEYLYARHAVERNNEIGKNYEPSHDFNKAIRDPNTVGASGMSAAEARKIRAQYERGPKAAAFAELARQARAINRAIQEEMVRSGLESADTISSWNRAYSDYVPLQGWEDPEDMPEGAEGAGRRGRGRDIRGREVKQAFGRRSKADSPIANLIAQAYRTYERAEQNRVLVSLAGALSQLSRDMRRAGANTTLADELGVRLNKGRPTKRLNKVTGLIETVSSPMDHFGENAVKFKIAGEPRYMVFDNAKLAQAIKTWAPGKLPGLLAWVQWVTNKMKTMWTHYSPTFIARHNARYFVEGMLNSFELKETGAHSALQYTKEGFPLLGEATRAIFARERGEEAGELGRSWDLLKKHGGNVALMAMRDIEQLKQDLRVKVNDLGRAQNDPRRAFHQMTDALNGVTSVWDNAQRLSAFHQALQQGMSPQEAAVKYGRDATVDYSFRGLWSNWLGLFQPFFNTALRTGDRMFAAGARSKIMRRVFLGTMAAGLVASAWNYLVGGKDKDGVPFFDKIPPWVRANSLILMNPFVTDAKGRPSIIKFPFPYNWAAPLATGYAAGNLMWGSEHVTDVVRDLLFKPWLSTFTQLGETGIGVHSLIPEMLQPEYDVAANSNWMGYRVHQDAAFQKGPNAYAGRKPIAGRVRTGEGWKDIAQFLNWASGGDRGHSGYLDFYPEDIREVVAPFIGTQMQFGEGLYDAGKSVANGQTPNLSKTPVVKVFTGTDYDAADRAAAGQRYWHSRHPWERK